MAWNEFTEWDAASQAAGAMGEAMAKAATFFDNTAKQLLEQASTSTQRAQLLQTMWQELDVLSNTAIHQLDAIDRTTIDAQTLTKLDAARTELAKATSFIDSAAWNAGAASQLAAIGKRLGAIAGAAEIQRKSNQSLE